MLEQGELIPEAFRRSGFERYAHSRELGAVERAFADDEFVLDPTRLTLYTARTGQSGFEFRSQVLMQQLGVQVNHTSINTVLMNATIGVTWGALSFLLDGFRRYAAGAGPAAGARQRRRAAPARGEDPGHHHRAAAAAGLQRLPPGVPHLRGRRRRPAGGVLPGLRPGRDGAPAADHRRRGAGARPPLVSTRFVVPYPPGFPILVPGQLVSPAIVEFMRRLDVKEVHGYRHDLGLEVFTPQALDRGAAHEPARAELAARADQQPLPELH